MNFFYFLKLLVFTTFISNVTISQTWTDVTTQPAYSALGIGGNKDGGHAWADYDLDGDLDLIVNDNSGTTLLENDLSGVGTFVDRTSALTNGMTNSTERSAVWADLNADGYPDFIVNDNNVIEVRLQHPGSNIFGDGLGGTVPQLYNGSNVSNGFNSEGVGVLDFDQDGDLDIFFDNHNHGTDLLENNGSGVFTHATPGTGTTLGLDQSATDGDYGSATDFNNDGFVDIMGRKRNQNDFFQNTGGTFINAADLAEANNGNKGAASLYDFDNDGDFDIFWTENGLNQIFQNNAGTWVPLAETVTGIYDGAGGGLPNYSGNVEGLACGDVDNDGDIDIFLGANIGYLWLNNYNNGSGTAMTFTLSSQSFPINGNGEGCTFVDIDEDGDLDLYVNTSTGTNHVYRNDLTGTSSNDFLFVDIKENRAFAGFSGTTGSGNERYAHGATVRLIDCDGNVLSGIREVNGGNGHGTQDVPKVHFGLPLGASTPVVVEVFYPAHNSTGSRVVYRQLVTPSTLGSGGARVITMYPTVPVNNPPIGQPDLILIDGTGNPVTFNPLANNGSGVDSDLDGDPLNLASLVGNGPSNGSAVVNSSTSITYTPNVPLLEVDNFDYYLSDNSCPYVNQVDTVTVTVLLDTDGDNIPNNIDIDDDNDGILDINECLFETSSLGPFTTSNTSWNITGTGGSGSAVLNTMTHNGITYTDFIFPDLYQENFASSSSNDIYEVNNNVDGNTGGATGNNISNPNWNNLILQAFQSPNLNYFQKQDNNIVPADYYTLTYNSPITVYGNEFLLISERGGNNNTDIQAFDVTNTALGPKVSLVANSANYLNNTGVTASNGQAIEIAVYSLTDFAPAHSQIKYLEITSNSTGDGADGKVIIISNSPTCADTDGDGIPNSLDLDSDNDGITDVIENGGSDPDNNGIIGTGAVPTDSDNDGLANDVDSTPTTGDPGSNGSPLADLDGDGIPNSLDLDSDGDGILDTQENGLTSDANNDGMIDGSSDSDNDGLLDSVDEQSGFGDSGNSTTTPNTDSDSNPDYLDIDADNDGIVDVIEGQTTTGYIAPSGNDADDDGIDDAYDNNDSSFGGNANNGITPVNTDGASDNPDYTDTDTDDDGKLDLVEGWDTNNNGTANTLPSGNDSDNDGLDDAFDSDGTSTTDNGGADNNGTLPTGFPDVDIPGGDMDWRQDCTPPSTPTAGSNGPVCEGSSLNLTASTITGATYAWVGPNSYSSNSQNPTVSSNSTTAMSGTYSVTATVAGCVSAAGSISVTVNPIPNSPTPGNNGPVCVGSTLSLNASTVSGASYSWTGPNGFTSNVQNPTVNANATVSMSGTYSVTVTVAGCTSLPATTTVTVNTIPSAPIAGSNSPICAVTGDINLTASTISGATYSWTGPSSYTSTSQNPTITGAIVSNAGTYNVTATVAGCISLSASTAVVVNTCGPTANDDVATSNLIEDGADGTISILGNDSDLNGTPTAPTNNGGQYVVDLDPNTSGVQTTFTNGTGTWTYNPTTGVVTFDPANDYNGTATITYELIDPQGNSDQGNITFMVNPVNDAPVVDNETHTTPEDTPVSGDLTDAGDSDVDGNLVVTTTPLTGPNNGSIVINSDGTYTYTPNQDYVGNDTVVVTICDDGTPLPALCTTDTIFIEVTAVNDAPSQGNETLTGVQEDAANPTTSVDLTGNNIDPDGTTVTVTTIVSTTGGGTVVNNGDGTVDYTPASNFNGVDTVIYTVCDAGTPMPAQCVNDTLFVTVDPVNDAPSQGNETLTVNEDDPATTSVDLTGNNIDPDGTTTTVTTIVSTTGGGTVVDNGDGTVNYTPASNFNGVDTVIYTVCDAGTPMPAQCVNDTLFVTVNPVNDAPSQGNETLTGVQEDAVNPTTSVDLTGNNIDPDGTTVTVTTIVSTTGGGTVVNNGDGTVDYTPAPNFNGVDTVIYTVCDAGRPMPAQCVNDTLFVTVDPVNDAPSQGNETLTVNEDDPATTSVDLTGNNIDPDGTTVTVTTIVSTTGGGTVVNNGDGTVDYTSASNFNGVDTVIYTVCDAGTPMPAQCVNDTLFVTVNPVNDPPVVDNEFVSVIVNGSVGGDLTDIGDSDIDGNLVVTTTPISGPSNGTIVINSDGTYTYTNTNPSALNDTIIVQICDDGTPLPALCVNDTIFVTITPTNPPIASPDSTMTLEDTPVTFNVTNDDIDTDGTIDDSTVDLDPNTPGIQNTFTSPEGVWTVDSNGNVTFTPNQDYNGDATITYTVNDNDGATSNVSTLTVTVTPVNDGPIVDNEFETTPEDTPFSGDLTDTGDFDVDGNLVVNTTPIDNPNHGNIVVNSDGTYTYTPDPDYSGVDTVIVEICDDGTPLPVICTMDTIFITVTPVNDAPSQGNENLTGVTEDATTPSTSPDLTANNLDPEGTTTNVTNVVSTTGGGTTVITNGGTTIDYTPAPNFNGIDTVIYTVCDNGLPTPVVCVNDTLFVVVSPVNDGPIVDNEFDTTPEDTPVSGDLTDAGDIDIDGNLVVNTTPISGASNGSIVINPDGTYTYSPNLDFVGEDTIVVEICDDGTPLPAICTMDTIFVTVTPINDAPVVDNEYHITTIDNPVNGDLTDLGDFDVDGNLVVNTTPISGPNNGSVVINSDGTYTYTPDNGYVGFDTILVEICDDGTPTPINCVTDTIFIEVINCDLSIATDDCDNDGLNNGEETTGIDDPNTPDTPNGNTSDPLNPDTDGDGVTDNIEGNDGTIPTDPCDLIITNQNVTPSLAWFLTDCDNDGLTNEEEITGVDNGSTPDTPNGNVTDPFNPDTDGDGVIDGTEGTDGSIPTNPCDYDSTSVTLAQAGDWNNADCDGDGVTNEQEVLDGTESFNPCDLIVANQNVNPDSTWLSNDCDNDGLTNEEETTGVDDPTTPENPNGNVTDPLDPDTDGDGVTDGVEAVDGTNPIDPCELIVTNQNVAPDSTWLSNDCDNDGLTNEEETTGVDDPTTPENPNGNVTDPLDPDTDGDGVTDGVEAIDGTNPNDPCELIVASQNTDPSSVWNDNDCDNDGLTNEEELTGIDNPITSDNPNGNITDPLNPDTDGDGVVDGTEVTDGTDPNDPCSFIEESITVTVTADTPCELHIPEGFSPNGDGVNDYFVIEGLEKYENVNLMILNRWGNKVYEASDYQNNWDGTNQFGVSVGGNELPTATYFYILDLGEGEEPVKGYVYLNR